MPRITGIKACVFDAYGTLFDTSAAAQQARTTLGDKTDALAALWRQKQLEYTWLRSLMGTPYRDFWGLTGDALDYAMAALGIHDHTLHQRLMAFYFELDAYPEVPAVLGELKALGKRTAILSNGSSDMLTGAVKAAGIDAMLDAVFSVDTVKIYKPHPSVYQIAVDRLGVQPGQICFLSSNAWDVAGAANFGFKTVWVNRFRQPAEPLPGKPVAVIDDLKGLLTLLLG
jgi:2-haloacid dehalogenase